MSPNLEREALLQQVDRILQKPDFSREDKSRVDGLLQLADSLHPARAELRRSKLAWAEADLGIVTSDTLRTDKAYSWFIEGLRHGAAGLPAEARAQSVAVDSAGGFIAPQVFSDNVAENMAIVDPLFDEAVVNVQQTLSGGSFQWPVIDNSVATAAIVAENQGFAESADAVFDAVLVSKAQTWRCDAVRVSAELAADSAFPLGDILAQSFSRRLARGVGSSFVSTLLAGATAGKTGTSTSSLVYEDLVDLYTSVDPSYSESPTAGWLMKMSTLIAVLKLKDSNNRPLFHELPRDANGRLLLFEKPIHITPSMPTLGRSGSPLIGNRAIAFGDLKYFLVRRVQNGIRVVRNAERYAEYGQVVYFAFWRGNAGLGKASGADSPIKYFKNADS